MAEEKVVLAMDEAFCRSCGEVIKKEAEICVKCGVRQKQVNNGEKSEKSWAVLLVLSIFLGEIGVDRFYAGHIGMGIGKLIVFIVALIVATITCGIGMPLMFIWWLIDLIIVATGKMKDGEGKYITNSN